MAEFFEKIQKGIPKLPENYWETQNYESDSLLSAEFITIFDNNLKSSMKTFQHNLKG